MAKISKPIKIAIHLFLTFSTSNLSVWAGDPLPLSRLLNCKILFRSYREGLLHNTPQKAPQIQVLKKEMDGLDYDGILPWALNEEELLDYKIVRYHGVTDLSPAVPKFDKTQPIGLATVKLKDIRFSQLTCKNEMEGGYTVIGNARAFSNGTLSMDVFKDRPIEVWRDVEGRIWSIDHRRLVAMKMAGNIDEIPVKFITPDQQQMETFKYTTQSEGRSIFLLVEPKAGEKPLAVVYMNEELRKIAEKGRGPGTYRQVKSPIFKVKNINDYLKFYPKDLIKKWKATRGEEHLDKLMYYADELAEDFNIIQQAERLKLIDSFDEFGTVTVRGKQFDSVLTKLVKQDIKAFQEGAGGIRNIKIAQDAIGDGIGGRLMLQTSGNVIDPKTTQAFVDHLCEEIKKGLRVTHLENYRAEANFDLPYLSEGQIDQIIKADREARLALELDPSKMPEPMVITTGKKAIREDGYSGFQLNVEYPSGYNVELQIRGPVFHRVAEVNHLFYDISRGKPLPPAQAKNPEILKLVKKFKALSDKEKNKMYQYMEDHLIHARKVESGIDSVEPVLPPSLSGEFRLENLKRIILPK